jgi:hypothetical protein
MISDSKIVESEVLRYPRLDTIIMVEEFIKNHDGEFKKRKLWESLPKKMMYQTYCVIITYLLESRKISIDFEKKLGWIYYPEKAEEHLLKKHLYWKSNETSKQNKISRRKNKASLRKSR